MQISKTKFIFLEGGQTLIFKEAPPAEFGKAGMGFFSFGNSGKWKKTFGNSGKWFRSGFGKRWKIVREFGKRWKIVREFGKFEIFIREFGNYDLFGIHDRELSGIYFVREFGKMKKNVREFGNRPLPGGASYNYVATSFTRISTFPRTVCKGENCVSSTLRVLTVGWIYHPLTFSI